MTYSIWAKSNRLIRKIDNSISKKIKLTLVIMSFVINNDPFR
jgi:hypothetical protein